MVKTLGALFLFLLFKFATVTYAQMCRKLGALNWQIKPARGSQNVKKMDKDFKKVPKTLILRCIQTTLVELNLGEFRCGLSGLVWIHFRFKGVVLNWVVHYHTKCSVYASFPVSVTAGGIGLLWLTKWLMVGKKRGVMTNTDALCQSSVSSEEAISFLLLAADVLLRNALLIK